MVSFMNKKSTLKMIADAFDNILDENVAFTA